MVLAHRLGRSAFPKSLLADYPVLSLLLVHPDLCLGVGLFGVLAGRKVIVWWVEEGLHLVGES